MRALRSAEHPCRPRARARDEPRGTEVLGGRAGAHANLALVCRSFAAWRSEAIFTSPRKRASSRGFLGLGAERRGRRGGAGRRRLGVGTGGEGEEEGGEGYCAPAGGALGDRGDARVEEEADKVRVSAEDGDVEGLRGAGRGAGGGRGGVGTRESWAAGALKARRRKRVRRRGRRLRRGLAAGGGDPARARRVAAVVELGAVGRAEPGCDGLAIFKGVVVRGPAARGEVRAQTRHAVACEDISARVGLRAGPACAYTKCLWAVSHLCSARGSSESPSAAEEDAAGSHGAHVASEREEQAASCRTCSQASASS